MLFTVNTWIRTILVKFIHPVPMTNKQPEASASILKYNPQLDGLRFCAVLFVVSYHWLPSIDKIPVSSFFGGVVNFFFVLSSYLITRILFSAKEKSLQLAITKGRVMLVFLMRRTIRIFPAYYLFLLIVLLLPTIGSEVREHAGMYFSYLANYHIFQSQDFPNVTPHIWTLAVEEQFYLLWPIVILFIPHRHLLKTFLFIIISSVALRALAYYQSPGVPQAILTQYCADAFAVGGILAYQYTIASDKEKLLINKWLNIALFTGIPVGIAIIVFKSAYYSFVFNRLLFAVISMKVIDGAVKGYKSYFGRFLENRSVIYLGRISYGIYLYHLLVPVVFWKLYDIGYDWAKTNHPSFFLHHQKAISGAENVLSSEPVCFIIYSILVITVATLSAKYLEAPLSRLKVSYDFSMKKSFLKRLNEPTA